MIFLFACNSPSTNNQGDKSQKNIAKQNSYFDFDEIEYYNNPIPETKFIEVLKNSRKSEKDSIKSGLLLFNIPKSLFDTLFISKLEEINYKKKSIDPSKFAEINQIFTEKSAKDQLTTSCDPMYRNILIFRKKHSLVGIAKICFACMYHQIVGTSANTQNFGQDGDYEKLRAILFK
jgi:hypothetical protein